jgi:hypothetical protein
VQDYELPEAVRRAFAGKAWINIDKLAEALETDRWTLAEHIAAGDLPYHQIGVGKKRPRRRFTPGDVAEFLAKQKRREQPYRPPRSMDVSPRTYGGEIVNLTDLVKTKTGWVAKTDHESSRKSRSRKKKY